MDVSNKILAQVDNRSVTKQKRFQNIWQGLEIYWSLRVQINKRIDNFFLRNNSEVTNNIGLCGHIHLKDKLSFWKVLFRPQDKFSGQIFALRTK